LAFFVFVLFVIGLFWLSSYGEVYAFGYVVWCGSLVVIANMVCFVCLSIGIIVLEQW
jgi:hypothetical protein